MKRKERNKILKAVHMHPENRKRAQRGAVAIATYTALTDTDPEDALCDLLSDLRHWADLNKIIFSAENIRGKFIYDDEVKQPEL